MTYRRTDRDEEGFTLVELLVVIVILGILAAIVVFAVGGITDKGTATATAADRNTLQASQEAFFANQKPVGTYATETDLVTKNYLRSPSTLNFFCLKPAVAGVITDYVVVSVSGTQPMPTSAAEGSTACTAAGKAGYTASTGVAPLP